MARRKPASQRQEIVPVADQSGQVKQMARLLDQARRDASRVVNSALATTYWVIGRRIDRRGSRGRSFPAGVPRPNQSSGSVQQRYESGRRTKSKPHSDRRAKSLSAKGGLPPLRFTNFWSRLKPRQRGRWWAVTAGLSAARSGDTGAAAAARASAPAVWRNSRRFMACSCVRMTG